VKPDKDFDDGRGCNDGGDESVTLAKAKGASPKAFGKRSSLKLFSLRICEPDNRRISNL
jgi:hypothetical protein